MRTMLIVLLSPVFNDPVGFLSVSNQPPIQTFHAKRPIEALNKLAGAVNDFLLGQLSFERYKRFPFGERRHGAEGIYDYYAEELRTNDLNVIICFLSYLAHRRVKGHWRCSCGSGQKMRHCHYSKLLDLRDKIDGRVARESLSKLKEARKRRPVPIRTMR